METETVKIAIVLVRSGIADGAERIPRDARGAAAPGAADASAGCGPWDAFARLLRKSVPNEEVERAAVDIGGTAFSPRNRGNGGPGAGKVLPLRGVVDGIRSAMRQGEVCAVVWDRRGCDCGPEDAETLEAELGKAVTNLRRDAGLPETVPFVTGTQPRFAGGRTSGAAACPSPTPLDKAIERLTAKVPCFGLVSSRGLSDCGDGVHPDAASQREFGERHFRMWRSMSAVPPGKIAAQRAKYENAPRVRTQVLLDPGEFLVTSPFGRRTHPVTGECGAMHNGVDGALWNGRMLLETGICAWRDGIVSAAEEGDGPAGNFVVVDHGGGWVSRYFHLEDGTLRVTAGMRVAGGTLLGWMGRSGRATGEHLHFQLERDGNPVDPFPMLG